MSRVDSGYAPRPEGIQVAASPNIATEQARFDPRGSSAFRLAEALSAAGPEIDKIASRVQDSEREAARAYANSMTVDDLGKKIKSGEMLPSQSPLFAATLHHIYGENTMDHLERDTLSKLQTGQLKFNTQEELDQYLTDQRNTSLQGADKYTIAGFDNGWDKFKTSLSTANARITDEQFMKRGVQEGEDNLHAVLTQVTSTSFKGTKADAAAAITGRYQLLRKTALLRDEQAKEALGGLLASVAQSGDQDLMNELLKQKLDNGISVQAILGSTKATSLQQHTLMQDDNNQRQRVDVELRPFVEWADKGELEGKNRKQFDEWIKKNERWLTTSTIHSITNSNLHAQARVERQLMDNQMLAAAQASVANAQQATMAAIEGGKYAFLPQQKVLTPQGESIDFKQKEFAQEYLMKSGASLPFDKQVQRWETNGLPNPEWEKVVQAGVSNVASVGWTYDGKNVGQLNPQGQAAIQKYLQISAVSPAAADKLAGKDADLMSDIKFMIERGGMPDLSQAAAFVNQVHRSGITKADYDLMKTKVKSAVDAVVFPHLWSRPVDWVKSFFGNGQTNLVAIQHDIRRRAELLVQSGQVRDPDTAVKATVEYLSNPAVTSKVNGTIYYNKDLPTAPKGEEPSKWFGRFIDEVPSKLATDRKMDPKDVRLEVNQAGGFTAWIAGVPLTDTKGNVVTYTKQQVSEWIGKKHEESLHNMVLERNKPKAKKGSPFMESVRDNPFRNF